MDDQEKLDTLAELIEAARNELYLISSPSCDNFANARIDGAYMALRRAVEIIREEPTR